MLKDQIYRVYTTFASETKNILTRVAFDSISDTSTNYSAYDFFQKRREIQDQMSTDLNEKLRSYMSYEVIFFQLRSINLPDSYEDAIEQTEVTKQSILKADALRNKNFIVQGMYVEQAYIAKNITINNARGVAEAKKLKADATAGTQLNITRSQAEAYSGLKGNVSLSNTELIEYLQIGLVQNYPSGQLVISLKDPVATAISTSA